MLQHHARQAHHTHYVHIQHLLSCRIGRATTGGYGRGRLNQVCRALVRLYTASPGQR